MRMHVKTSNWFDTGKTTATRDKKNLPWLGVGYDFYSTRYMLYVENTQLVG